MFECIPEAVLGIPFYPFIGVVLGTLFAVNEAVRTKFRKAVLKVESDGETIIFDNRYLVTAIIGICVVVLTVASIKDAGLLNPVPNTVTGLTVALVAGFSEGWAVIRALNSRLDVFIKQKAVDKGVSDKKAEKLADAIEFVEVEQKEEPKSTFEEL